MFRTSPCCRRIRTRSRAVPCPWRRLRRLTHRPLRRPSGYRRSRSLHRHHPAKEHAMPRGDKSAYTDKQKRQARHIEESYEERGVDPDKAAEIAWATVNKETSGGKLSGSGRGHPVDRVSSRKGGRIGGAASAARTPEERSASARKAAATRKRNAEAKRAASAK